ncbi:MAG: TatD family hydrolase, partial [Dysgonamonadaceae bacterium]|nr:TatD family hydrolase [Dysgonamonadaceae bacterium]
MKLIDTHTHIYQNDFVEDIIEVIENAKSRGVYKFLIPNVDVETIVPLNDLCNRYPDECFPMMGLHPTSVNDSYSGELNEIKKQLANADLRFGLRKYIAVGEIGIDLYWDKTFLKEQKIVFEEQLRWSIDYNLPAVIHTRDAFPEVIESIAKIGANNLRGVFHSFGGSKEELE